MSQYRLTPAGGVIHTTENIYIPNDPKNIYWQRYLQWVDDGNTADPIAIKPTPSMLTANIGGSQNFLINGNFDIWQRGTLWLQLSESQYTADRFRYSQHGTMVLSGEQSENLPDPADTKSYAKYSLLLSCTTAQPSIGSADYSLIEQRIEGYHIRLFYDTTIALSFCVRASTTGTFCVSLSNGVDRSYVLEFTIDNANTWEKKTALIPIDVSNGTWDFSTGTGLRVIWCLTSGTDYHATAAEQWENGLYYCTSAQTNFCGDTHTFAISQMQITHDTYVKPYQNVLPEKEISQCLRYYEKSYPLTIDPGEELHTGLALLPVMYTKNKYFAIYVPFQVPKRALPAMKAWDAAGNTNRTTAWTKDWDNIDNISTTATQFEPTHRGFVYREKLTGNNYGTIGRHWSADAEL